MQREFELNYELDFIKNSKRSDLNYSTGEGLVDVIASLEDKKQHISCYLAYYEDKETNQNELLQLTFCQHTQDDFYLVDNLKIENSVLDTKDKLEKFMNEKLDRFAMNLKEGKYELEEDELDNNGLGGSYFEESKQTKKRDYER